MSAIKDLCRGWCCGSIARESSLTGDHQGKGAAKSQSDPKECIVHTQANGTGRIHCPRSWSLRYKRIKRRRILTKSSTSSSAKTQVPLSFICICLFSSFFSWTTIYTLQLIDFFYHKNIVQSWTCQKPKLCNKILSPLPLWFGGIHSEIVIIGLYTLLLIV